MKHFKKYCQTITIETREQVDEVDEFNKKKYVYVRHPLSGVLVKPENGTDVTNDGLRLEGHKIEYCLYIRKGAGYNWENARVFIKDKWYKVIGAPREYPACPTDYDTVVYVEGYNG